MEGIRKLFAKGRVERKDYLVHGSGLVSVPEYRMTEIPNVIAEHHLREAELARVLASVRRA